ncbi:MAG: hypothetical protein LBN29_10135 [Mediterranea sp.]|jgi:hypothetical protein|nr:hypothetical protein [Mediterranea sp.]
MNKLFFYTAAVFTMLFASCSQNEEVVTTTSKAKDATLSVMLVGQPLSRTAGIPAVSGDLPGESNLNTVTMALFDSTGNLSSEIKTFTTDLTGTLNINVISGTGQTLFVLANIPESYFTGLTTLAEFYGVKAKLTDILNAAGEFDSYKLPMMGKVDNMTVTKGDALLVDVIMTRMVARVMLNSIDIQVGTKRPGATFVPTRVFMYNSATEMLTDPTKDFLSTWSAINTGEEFTNPTGLEYLGNDYDALAPNNKFWYYIPSYEYDATDPDWEDRLVKLVIKGQYKASATDAEKTVYYMIVVNNDQYGAVTFTGNNPFAGDGKIYHNTTYTINAVLKGQGSDSPGDNVTPTMLDVNLTVDGWALDITQDITFG